MQYILSDKLKASICRVEKKNPVSCMDFPRKYLLQKKVLSSPGIHIYGKCILNLSLEYHFPALHVHLYIPSHSLPLSVSFCHAFTLIVVAAISVPVRRICFTVCLKAFQLKRRIERGKFFLDTTFRQVGAGWFNPFPLPLGW